MKKLMLVLVALGLAVPAAAVEFDLPPGKWWENQRLADHIGLGDEQTGAIRDIVYQHARRMIDLKAEVELAGLDLAESVNRPQFVADDVRSAYRAFQAARQALENERFEMLLAVREVLTYEQWQKLQDVKRRFGNREQRRPGSPRPGGGSGQRAPDNDF